MNSPGPKSCRKKSIGTLSQAAAPIHEVVRAQYQKRTLSPAILRPTSCGVPQRSYRKYRKKIERCSEMKHPAHPLSAPPQQPYRPSRFSWDTLQPVRLGCRVTRIADARSPDFRLARVNLREPRVRGREPLQVVTLVHPERLPVAGSKGHDVDQVQSVRLKFILRPRLNPGRRAAAVRFHSLNACSSASRHFPGSACCGGWLTKYCVMPAESCCTPAVTFLSIAITISGTVLPCTGSSCV